MAVTKTNDYNIATNADLGNVLNNVDLNRIGADLTALELDGSTVKVSVGSIIESQGSLYKVDTAAETPTGTASAGAYLFFDDSVPGFVWSATPGTYDPARGGVYDASDRRQCKWQYFDQRSVLISDAIKQLSPSGRYEIMVPPNGSTLIPSETDTAVSNNEEMIYLEENKVFFYRNLSGRTYTFDGSSFVEGATITSDTPVQATRISSTRVAIIRTSPSVQLAMLEESGSSWSVVGSPASITVTSSSQAYMETIDDSTVVFVSFGDAQIWQFNGATWSQVGSTIDLSLLGLVNPVLVRLSKDTFAAVEAAASERRVSALRWDGTTFSRIGNTALLPDDVTSSEQPADPLIYDSGDSIRANFQRIDINTFVMVPRNGTSNVTYMIVVYFDGNDFSLLSSAQMYRASTPTYGLAVLNKERQLLVGIGGTTLYLYSFPERSSVAYKEWV